MKKIDCRKCKRMMNCCETGAWLDLEEAKKILDLGLHGQFYHLEKDKEFPSGYKIGSSIEYNPCSFLTREGLCSIHVVDYKLKPQHCKEFPYENGKLSPVVKDLCIMHPDWNKKNKKRKE